MKLSVIAVHIGAAIDSTEGNREIFSISSPDKATDNDITFLSNPKYREKMQGSAAAAVIVKKGDVIPGKLCLEVDDPYVGYALTAQLFEDLSPGFGEGISLRAFIDASSSVHPSSSIGHNTVIGPDVIIGEKCRIGANCVIEKGTRVGAQTRIDSGVVIRWGTQIGSRVVIQSGAVIGSDGFGNARLKSGEWVRIPAFGIVVIEDDVDIGACTTIDRGNFEPTVISRGTKLDNLIHIAHNVEIGENSAIAAQTGISGSTKVGKRVIIAGQAGFVGHIEIGDDSFVGAKAGVSKSVEPGAKITGYPARDLMGMRRIEASQAQLPDLLKEVKRLSKEVESLKKTAGSV